MMNESKNSKALNILKDINAYRRRINSKITSYEFFCRGRDKVNKYLDDVYGLDPAYRGQVIFRVTEEYIKLLKDELIHLEQLFSCYVDNLCLLDAKEKECWDNLYTKTVNDDYHLINAYRDMIKSILETGIVDESLKKELKQAYGKWLRNNTLITKFLMIKTSRCKRGDKS